jgi:FAS-associated factor 2
VWAGDVKYVQGYKLSGVMGATHFPFMAFVIKYQSKMKLVHKFQGYHTTTECLDVLHKIVSKIEPLYVQERHKHESREEERSIRNQQDEAYEISLRADKEKVVLMYN